MTPDADRDTQRIDGLLAAYGELTKAEGILGERISSNERAVSQLQQAQRDTFAEMWRALQKVGEKCEEHTQRVEDKIDAQSPKFGPAQRAIVIASIIAANGAIVAALIGVLNHG